jgi:hypothetical protein
MEHLLVAKDVAYTSKLGGGTIADQFEGDLLADGALVVYDDDGNIVTSGTAAAALNDCVEFSIALGALTAANTPLRTFPINRFSLSNFTKNVYAAPTNQVGFIGNDGAAGALSLPGTLVVGTVATVIITDTSKGYVDAANTRVYQYKLVGTPTAQLILEGLRDLINADSGLDVTAAVVGANVGLSITANNNDLTFNLGVSDILVDATITNDGSSNSVNRYSGVGTPAQLTKMQFEGDINLGKSNTLGQGELYFTKPDYVAAAGTYTVYTFQSRKTGNNVTRVMDSGPVMINLAVPSGAGALITELDAIFALLVPAGTPNVA